MRPIVNKRIIDREFMSDLNMEAKDGDGEAGFENVIRSSSIIMRRHRGEKENND
jgi:hypothetical protein